MMTQYVSILIWCLVINLVFCHKHHQQTDNGSETENQNVFKKPTTSSIKLNSPNEIRRSNTILLENNDISSSNQNNKTLKRIEALSLAHNSKLKRNKSSKNDSNVNKGKHIIPNDYKTRKKVGAGMMTKKDKDKDVMRNLDELISSLEKQETAIKDSRAESVLQDDSQFPVVPRPPFVFIQGSPRVTVDSNKHSKINDTTLRKDTNFNSLNGNRSKTLAPKRKIIETVFHGQYDYTNKDMNKTNNSTTESNPTMTTNSINPLSNLTKFVSSLYNSIKSFELHPKLNLTHLDQNCSVEDFKHETIPNKCKTIAKTDVPNPITGNNITNKQNVSESTASVTVDHKNTTVMDNTIETLTENKTHKSIPRVVGSDNNKTLSAKFRRLADYIDNKQKIDARHWNGKMFIETPINLKSNTSLNVTSHSGLKPTQVHFGGLKKVVNLKTHKKGKKDKSKIVEFSKTNFQNFKNILEARRQKQNVKKKLRLKLMKNYINFAKNLKNELGVMYKLLNKTGDIKKKIQTSHDTKSFKMAIQLLKKKGLMSASDNVLNYGGKSPQRYFHRRPYYHLAIHHPVIRLPVNSQHIAHYHPEVLKHHENVFFKKQIDGNAAQLQYHFDGRKNPHVDNKIKSILATIEGNIYRILAKKVHFTAKTGNLLRQQVHNATYAAVFESLNKTCGEWIPSRDTLGTLSSWGSWGHCSVTCGQGGFQLRKRNCTTKKCVGSLWDMKECGKKSHCKATWMNWSGWGPCSASCNAGYTTKTRICIAHSNTTTCEGGSAIKVKPCNKAPCKKLNNWTKWGGWSQCSVTCERGIQGRRRICKLKNSARSKLACEGAASENRMCVHSSCSGGTGIILDTIVPDKDVALICDKSVGIYSNLVTWRTPSRYHITPKTRSKRFKVSGSYLIIKNLQDFDRGLYRCTTFSKTTFSTSQDCRNNRCLNGGQCIEHSQIIINQPYTVFVCVCSSGYKGRLCDEEVGMRWIHIAGIIAAIVTFGIAKILLIYLCFNWKKSMDKKKEKDKGEKKGGRGTGSILNMFSRERLPIDIEMDVIKNMIFGVKPEDDKKTKNAELQSEIVVNDQSEDKTAKVENAQNSNNDKGSTVFHDPYNDSDTLLKAIQDDDMECVVKQLSLEKLQNNPELVTKILTICDEENISSSKDITWHDAVDKTESMNELLKESTHISDNGTDVSNTKINSLDVTTEQRNKNTSHLVSESNGTLVRNTEELKIHHQDEYVVKSVQFTPSRTDGKSPYRTSYQVTPYPRPSVCDDELPLSNSITNNTPCSSSTPCLLKVLPDDNKSLVNSGSKNIRMVLSPHFDQIGDKIFCHKHKTFMILDSVSKGGLNSSEAVCQHGMKPTDSYMKPFQECCMDDHGRILDIVNGFVAGYSASSEHKQNPYLNMDMEEYFSDFQNTDPQILSQYQTISTPKRKDNSETRSSISHVSPITERNQIRIITGSLDSALSMTPSIDENSFFSSKTEKSESRNDADRVLPIDRNKSNQFRVNSDTLDSSLQLMPDLDDNSFFNPKPENPETSNVTNDISPEKRRRIRVYVNNDSLDSSLQTMPDLDENSFFNRKYNLTNDSQSMGSSSDSFDFLSSVAKRYPENNKSASLDLSEGNYTFSPVSNETGKEIQNVITASSMVQEQENNYQNKSTKVDKIFKDLKYISTQGQNYTEDSLDMVKFNRVMFPIPEDPEDESREPDLSASLEFRTPFTSVTEFESVIEMDLDTDADVCPSTSVFQTPFPSEYWLGKRNSLDNLQSEEAGDDQDTVWDSFYQQDAKPEEYLNPVP